MSFPQTRLRRLRQHPALRRMVQETRLSVDQLVAPLFVCPGKGVRRTIASMPGQSQLSIDFLIPEVKAISKAGIPAVLLFGLPKRKDAQGSEAYARNGIIQQAARALKDKMPELLVITDLCFCEYTDHGHCGIIKKKGRGDAWALDNDATLDLIAKTAVSQAEAGADVVAPSGMIDGQVKTVRQALDRTGFPHLPILSYSAKYASAFYAPFREAVESAPKFGNRQGYQMNPANAQEALREAALDVEEGADIVMVKPALAYLDIIRRIKEAFPVPVAAYNVSGEYSLVKAAGQRGWVDEKAVILEILTAIRRAGADILITYHAKEVAELLS